MYSFWKILYPLTAAGYLVVPPSLIEAFSLTKQHVNRFFSSLEQRALSDFIKEGHLERHWQKTRTIYKKRRQALLFSLKQEFRDEVSFVGEGGGLHLTVSFHLSMSAQELIECADKVGLPMASTVCSYAENPVNNEFLIPFAAIAEEAAGPLTKQFREAIRKAVS